MRPVGLAGAPIAASKTHSEETLDGKVERLKARIVATQRGMTKIDAALAGLRMTGGAAVANNG